MLFSHRGESKECSYRVLMLKSYLCVYKKSEHVLLRLQGNWQGSSQPGVVKRSLVKLKYLHKASVALRDDPEFLPNLDIPQTLWILTTSKVTNEG